MARAKEHWQLKQIYGLAKGLGMDTDALHALAHSVAGVESLKDLDFAAANRVADRLRALAAAPAPAEPEPAAPGMATKAQQNLAWRLLYRLRELDSRHAEAPIATRCVGAIKKIVGADAPEADPMRWLTAAQVETLIEGLKRYVRSAERRAQTRGTG